MLSIIMLTALLIWLVVSEVRFRDEMKRRENEHQKWMLKSREERQHVWDVMCAALRAKGLVEA